MANEDSGYKPPEPQGTVDTAFARPFGLQIDTYVKPYMPKPDPQVLVVGPGPLLGKETVSWADAYPQGSVKAIERDAYMLEQGMAFAKYQQHIERYPQITVEQQSVEKETGQYDIVTWRNPKVTTNETPDRVIHHCLNLVANNGIAYFTTSSSPEYQTLLAYIKSFQQDGITIETLHPEARAWQMDDHRQLSQNPPEMQVKASFTDAFSVAVRIHRTS